MIGADTNLIIRFLVRDLEEQSEKVLEFINAGNELYINEVALSEISWVLLKIYKYSPREFIEAIDALLETEGFIFFDNELITRSINDFKKTSAGFTDCLINQINKARNIETYTFDKKASRLPGMNLLK